MELKSKRICVTHLFTCPMVCAFCHSKPYIYLLNLTYIYKGNCLLMLNDSQVPKGSDNIYSNEHSNQNNSLTHVSTHFKYMNNLPLKALCFWASVLRAQLM